MFDDDKNRSSSPRRVFYAAGPGDVIAAHRHWAAGEDDPTVFSITFSSQVEDFCRDIGADLLMVSSNPRRDRLVDGGFELEHRPKLWPGASGGAYHMREAAYALELVRRARKFRADVAIVDSGTTHYFLLGLFRRAGIPVVPVLHNGLWANGFPPTRGVSRAIAALDSSFWRRVPLVTLCVSPVCERQVLAAAHGESRPVRQFRAQFRRERFEGIPPPPSGGPFNMLFVGRIVVEKGVFDVVEAARIAETQAPGRLAWTICGSGPDLDALKARVASLDLQRVVDVRGWVSPQDLSKIYATTHCSIVPTRASFAEGLAMTAAESVMAGRPVLTNPVVPALELLTPAAVECRAEDPASYAGEALRLAADRTFYDRLRAACRDRAEPFFDRRLGLTATLKGVFGGEAPA